jgi:hypothetical protein
VSIALIQATASRRKTINDHLHQPISLEKDGRIVMWGSEAIELDLDRIPAGAHINATLAIFQEVMNWLILALKSPTRAQSDQDRNEGRD